MKILLVGQLLTEHSKLKVLMEDDLNIKFFLSDGLYNLNLNDFKIIICNNKLSEIMSRRYTGEVIYLNTTNEVEELVAFPNKTKNLQIINHDINILSLSFELYKKLLKVLNNELSEYKHEAVKNDEYLSDIDLNLLLYFIKSPFVMHSIEEIKEKLGLKEIDNNQIQNSVRKLNENNHINGIIKIGAFSYTFHPFTSGAEQVKPASKLG